MRRLRTAYPPLFALAIIVVACGASTPMRAQAQTEDRALALDLFEQGRALAARGDYVSALTKFEAAGKVMRTFGIMLNTAECLEKLGRTASAWAVWKEARAVAGDAHRASDEALAIARAKALEPKLARVTVVVPAAADLPNLEILRDGVALPRAAWGSALPIDPGPHAFEERAAGRKSNTVEIVVAPNATDVTATMTALELVGSASLPVTPASPSFPAAVVAQPGGAPASPGPEPASGGSGRRLAGWITGGAGVAAGIVGVVVALEGQSQHNTAVTTAEDAPSMTSSQYMLAESQESSAKATKNAGYVTVGVGGALLVTGVVLLLTAPSGHTPSASGITLIPSISRTGAGAGFSTEW